MNGATNDIVQEGVNPRMELSMSAMRAERRNRPRFLIILSCLVLAASVGYMLWVWAVRASIAANVSRTSSSLVSLEGVVSQLEYFDAQEKSARYAKDPGIDDAIQKELADAVHLEPRPVVTSKPSSFATKVKGFVKRTYSTSHPIEDADGVVLYQWVNAVLERYPGMQIETMKLSPGHDVEGKDGKDGKDRKVLWTLDITFRRWERQ